MGRQGREGERGDDPNKGEGGPFEWIQDLRLPPPGELSSWYVAYTSPWQSYYSRSPMRPIEPPIQGTPLKCAYCSSNECMRRTRDNGSPIYLCEECAMEYGVITCREGHDCHICKQIAHLVADGRDV